MMMRYVKERYGATFKYGGKTYKRLNKCYLFGLRLPASMENMHLECRHNAL